jgi:hypothetical protein
MKECKIVVLNVNLKSMLVQSSDVQISVTVERSGTDLKIPVDSTTTASDIVQLVARSPRAQRK